MKHWIILLFLLQGCSQLSLLSSGAGLATTQNIYVKAYNGVDMITNVTTGTDIKGHAYNKIKPKPKPLYDF